MLFAAQEANAGSEGAVLNRAEGEELRGINVVVDCGGVVAVSDVVEAASDRPMPPAKIETFFQKKIEREKSRKAASAGGLDQLLFAVYDIERKTGAGLGGILDIDVLKQGHPAGHDAGGEKAIGRIPQEWS